MTLGKIYQTVADACNNVFVENVQLTALHPFEYAVVKLYIMKVSNCQQTEQCTFLLLE